MLQVSNLSVTIAHKRILDGINFSLQEQEILMIVGPNGSGKTTLVRAMMHQVAYSGEVLWLGKEMQQYSPLERARSIGVLTQSNAMPFAYSAAEIVALGRYAHLRGYLGGLGLRDQEIIEQAMRTTKTWEFRDRSVTTLSGGELQRVCLARVFAQKPRLLILDEPTNHLDIEHQLQLFDLIKEWVLQEGRCVLAIVHDLNLAHAYGGKALLLHHGRVAAYGEPSRVMNRDNLLAVYRIDLAARMSELLQHWQKGE